MAIKDACVQFLSLIVRYIRLHSQVCRSTDVQGCSCICGQHPPLANPNPKRYDLYLLCSERTLIALSLATSEVAANSEIQAHCTIAGTSTVAANAKIQARPLFLQPNPSLAQPPLTVISDCVYRSEYFSSRLSVTGRALDYRSNKNLLDTTTKQKHTQAPLPNKRTNTLLVTELIRRLDLRPGLSIRSFKSIVPTIQLDTASTEIVPIESHPHQHFLPRCKAKVDGKLERRARSIMHARASNLTVTSQSLAFCVPLVAHPSTKCN
jgi:hypothetical protein